MVVNVSKRHHSLVQELLGRCSLVFRVRKVGTPFSVRDSDWEPAAFESMQEDRGSLRRVEYFYLGKSSFELLALVGLEDWPTLSAWDDASDAC